MPNFQICGAGGVITANKSHRLVLSYGNKYCRLVRFSVSKDCSINFSPYLLGATEISHQVIKPNDGKLHVQYGCGPITTIDQIKDKNILKINYHASGYIHHGNSRFKSKKIREITNEHELAMLVLMHPENMGLVDADSIGKLDMLMHFAISEECPIFVSITLAISGTLPSFKPKGVLLWTQILQFTSDDPSLGTVDIRFYFFKTNPGPWPPECGCLICGEPG